MSEEEKERTELGEADKTTMDSVIRTTLGKMFENDNDTAFLEVSLDSKELDEPPKVVLKLQLMSINGVKTRQAEEEE